MGVVEETFKLTTDMLKSYKVKVSAVDRSRIIILFSYILIIFTHFFLLGESCGALYKRVG